MQRIRRFVIPSDDHEFIGRVFDLLMPLHTGFENYKQARDYPDAVYVLNVGDRVDLLTRRVESLNLIGTMLWSRQFPLSFKQFPISRYEWLNITADTFLMRLISISDCALLLTNEVFRTGLKPHNCTIEALRKKGVPPAVVEALTSLRDSHIDLRNERNARIHHGIERRFSDDDATFRTAALFEHRLSGISGTDRYGRSIDLKRYFRAGLRS